MPKMTEHDMLAELRKEEEAGRLQGLRQAKTAAEVRAVFSGHTYSARERREQGGAA